MSIPLDRKVPMLNDFHTYLYQDEWCFTESQEKDRKVLEDFPTVSCVELRHQVSYLYQKYLYIFFLCRRYRWSLETLPGNIETSSQTSATVWEWEWQNSWRRKWDP